MKNELRKRSDPLEALRKKRPVISQTRIVLIAASHESGVEDGSKRETEE